MIFIILISIIAGVLITCLQIVEIEQMYYADEPTTLEVVGLITFFSTLVFTLSCGIFASIN